MNDFINGLFTGLPIRIFIGGFIGMATVALLAMARDPEPPKREPEQKEPTILWTKGNLCKLDGETYEIRGYEMGDEEHQYFMGTHEIFHMIEDKEE